MEGIFATIAILRKPIEVLNQLRNDEWESIPHSIASRMGSIAATQIFNEMHRGFIESNEMRKLAKKGFGFGGYQGERTMAMNQALKKIVTEMSRQHKPL